MKNHVDTQKWTFFKGRQAVRRRQVACGMRQVAGKRHIRSTAESNSQALLLLPKNVLAKCRIRIHQGRTREKGQGVAGVAGVFVWHICPSLLQSLLSLVLFFVIFCCCCFSSFFGGLLACTWPWAKSRGINSNTHNEWHEEWGGTRGREKERESKRERQKEREHMSA